MGYVVCHNRGVVTLKLINVVEGSVPPELRRTTRYTSTDVHKGWKADGGREAVRHGNEGRE